MALEDDIWALNRLADAEKNGAKGYLIGEGTYRYKDVDDVVHRAVWTPGRWTSLCGIKNPTQKVQEKDPGAVTCIECLGNGA